MRILFIPVHLIHVRIIPLGIAYIASYIRQFGHEVRIYDPPPYQKYHLPDVISRFQPDMIGISTLTPSFNKAVSIAQQLRPLTKAPIIFGGIHATSMPEKTLEYSCIDYVVIGEGEYTMKELVDSLDSKSDLSRIAGLGYKQGSTIRINHPRPPIENLDSMPFPARDLFPLNWYFQRSMGIRGTWAKLTNVISSRGCPYNCTYCASKVMFGQKVRFISPKRIIDEVEILIGQYGLDGVSFSDDTFSVNKDRAIEMCDEINKRKLTFIWRVQMRADTISERVIAALRHAGCIQVDVGVESGSERILKTIKKGITPVQVMNAAQLLKKYHMRMCATFMIGNPGETEKDIAQTRELAHRIKADYTQFFITTPYPGTEMYNSILQQYPHLIESMSYDNFRHGGENLQSLVQTGIPPDRLIDIHRGLNSEFLTAAVPALLFRNKYFIIDMMLLVLQRPLIIVRSMITFVRTCSIVKVYRLWYGEQNYRRF